MKTFKNILAILLVAFISMDANAQNEDKKTGCISGDCENGFGKYVYSISPEKYYEGNFKDGEKEGKGTYYDESFGGHTSKKYIGEFKNNLYHGKGILTYLGTYEGDFYLGMMHGKGIQKSYNGWVFEGEFKFNERFYGAFTFKDNTKYVGEYVDEKRNGKGKYYDENSQLQFEGRFKDGQLIKNVTKGKKNYEVGIYEGEIVNGLADGYGIFTMSDGTVHKGTYKDDAAHGYGTMTTTNGSKYVGQFKKSKFNGYGTLTNPDGSKIFGKWKDNVIDTRIAEYDKNGKLKVKEKKKSNSMFETIWGEKQ
jgi:hypothetical protein